MVIDIDRCVAFRPFLYLSTWIATLIVLTSGDFAAVPQDLRDEAEGIFWVWGGLSLWSGPTALLSEFLIQKSSTCKYRAMWLRLGADVAQLVSILVYLIMKLYVGDYNIYSTAITFAAMFYVVHLILWDSKQLIGVEKLASRLEKARSV